MSSGNQFTEQNELMTNVDGKGRCGFSAGLNKGCHGEGASLPFMLLSPAWFFSSSSQFNNFTERVKFSTSSVEMACDTKFDVTNPAELGHIFQVHNMPSLYHDEGPGEEVDTH